MAHYALLDDKNVVIQVFPGKDELTDGIDWEVFYGDELGGKCLRTSYHTHNGMHREGGEPFRYNYAGPGMIYMEDLDAFIMPNPFKTWIFDVNSMTWVPPTEKPENVTEERTKELTLPGGEIKTLTHNAILIGYYWDEESEDWSSFTEEELSIEENRLKYQKTQMALSQV